MREFTVTMYQDENDQDGCNSYFEMSANSSVKQLKKELKKRYGVLLKNILIETLDDSDRLGYELIEGSMFNGNNNFDIITTD